MTLMEAGHDGWRSLLHVAASPGLLRAAPVATSNAGRCTDRGVAALQVQPLQKQQQAPVLLIECNWTADLRGLGLTLNVWGCNQLPADL